MASQSSYAVAVTLATVDMRQNHATKQHKPLRTGPSSMSDSKIYHSLRAGRDQCRSKSKISLL